WTVDDLRRGVSRGLSLPHRPSSIVYRPSSVRGRSRMLDRKEPQAGSVEQITVKPATYHGRPRRKRPAPRAKNPPRRDLRSAIRRLRWTEFRLLLIPSLLSIVGMLMVILVPTGAVQWQWTGIWQSFLFTGLLYGVHLWLNISRPRADQVVLPLVGVI